VNVEKKKPAGATAGQNKNPSGGKMSNSIVPFNFNDHQVRVVTIDGEPWFVLTDLAKVLDIAAVGRLASRLDDGVRQTHTILDSLGRDQNAVIVNESGMYEVVIRSDKPEAAAFRRWITGTVLPEIRKTGGYGVQYQIPQTYAAALELAALQAREIEQLEAKTAEDAPKVLFADSVATSHTTILIGDLAKILRGNGIEIGANRLFEWMRANGYLIKREGTDRNMPTQKSMELGLFKVKETAVTHSDGHVTISKTPKVTGKGQSYFIEKFLAPESEMKAAA